MNEREALKLALEALEAINLTGIKYQEKPVETIGRIRGVACDAIEAIKDLAQPVKMVLPPITEPTAKSEPVSRRRTHER